MNKDNSQLGVVSALVRSTFLVNAVYAESARHHGLTSQQGQLLCVLMSEPYGMGELSATLGLAKSSLSGLVDRSERNGLVRRYTPQNDTRAVCVTLTPKGRGIAERFYTDACLRIDKLAIDLEPEQREQLAALLGAVVLNNAVPVVFMEAEQPITPRRERSSDLAVSLADGAELATGS